MTWHGLRRRVAVLAVLSCFACGTAAADDVDDCNQPKDLDLRIRGCSALTKNPQIRSGDKAVVLQLRGNAFRAKREFDRALADYIEAMSLADDDTVRRSTETGIMMTLTQGPAELRSTPNGRKAIEIMEKSFQKSKASRPAPK